MIPGIEVFAIPEEFSGIIEFVAVPVALGSPRRSGAGTGFEMAS